MRPRERCTSRPAGAGHAQSWRRGRIGVRRALARRSGQGYSSGQARRGGGA